MRNRYKRITRDLISKKELRRFVGPSIGHWLGAVAVEWAIVAATMWACNAFPYWWVWVVGFFLVGTRQHALGVLVHDGSHHLVSRSLFWNDLLSNYLTAYPMTFTVQGFRSTHLSHHWYLETPDDSTKVTIDHHPQEWTFPMSKRKFAGMLLRDLTGLSRKSLASLLKYLWDIPGEVTRHIVSIVALHGFSIALFAFTGHIWTYVLLWILPLLTVAIACYRIRAIAEHSGIGPQEGRYTSTSVDSLLATRTTVSSPFVQFIFAPYNITYHIEHHLYPSVPGFRLRELHSALRDHPDYVEHAHLTRGYRQLFREVTTTGGRAVPAKAQPRAAPSSAMS